MADSKPLVVVTRKLPANIEEQIASRYDARFNRGDAAMSPDQLTHAVRNADAILCTVTDRIGAEQLSGSTRARIIANFGVGVNHIDLAAAKAAGIVVTNTPDVLTDDTADLALALILMCMRRLGEGERHVRSGAWSGWRPTHMMGRTAHGKTLGIVGYGRIGRAVARRAALALGMRVLWYSPRDPRIDDAGSDGPPGAERVATLEALLAASDVVSLHCPATPDTRHMMNASTFGMMKHDAYLINTARGDVLDEYALIEAVRDGLIAGAGLDVYEFEPSVVADLRELQQVVLLPHLGSATIETRTAMGEKALANIDAFMHGQEPPNRVA